ncbi:uncharacterized protein [Cicer arietinum]|uniref:Uncharacterized protein LOC101502261 n=1 Tax=Cicer arietinum TaxID=3827 RepID=A0A3Q7YC93_CICAR|nr:uncharacterized protein LOC101502261 [Cicer arietinum]
MAASTVLSNFPLHFTCRPSSAHKNPQPNLSIRFNAPSNRASRFGSHSPIFRWSRFCVAAIVPQRLPRRVFRVHGFVGDDDCLTSPQPGASIDLNLPRRSLLVQFTCDLCGERTKKLVNRLAYERGTIFIQCAGCKRHHKLVDNLGLITEYDFREKMKTHSEIDQNQQ